MDNARHITNILLPQPKEYATQALYEEALKEYGYRAHMSAKKGQQAREEKALEMECIWALLVALMELVLLILPLASFQTALFEQVYPIFVKPGATLSAIQKKTLLKLFSPNNPASTLVDELEVHFKARARNAAYNFPQARRIMGFAHAPNSLSTGLSLLLPVMESKKRRRVEKFTFNYLDTLQDEFVRPPSMMPGQVNWVPRKHMNRAGSVLAIVFGLGDAEGGYDDNDKRTTFVQGIHD